ncbi:MAG: hypothetical protein GX558_06635, partial [Clostridiales bacterium]|nr:hypothetical protein [Clostridiales bacterium]
MRLIRELLLDHAARYPAMAPQDAVKLLYQREMGAGHLVAGWAQALSRLAAEYVDLAPGADAPAFEDIGNGLARCHLAGYRALGGSPQALCRAFMRCANAPRGDAAALDTALGALQALCREGALPFEAAELDEYL